MAASRNVSRNLVNAGLWSALALLAGCDNTGSAGAFGTPPLASDIGNTMEFRGERACVDCLAIHAVLRLEHRGSEQRYTLVEHYLAVDRERRFEEQGQWQSRGDLLRLRSGAGGERVYAVLADNRLQAVDSRGRAQPALAGEIMVPTSYSNGE